MLLFDLDLGELFGHMQVILILLLRNEVGAGSAADVTAASTVDGGGRDINPDPNPDPNPNPNPNPDPNDNVGDRSDLAATGGRLGLDASEDSLVLGDSDDFGLRFFTQ